MFRVSFPFLAFLVAAACQAQSDSAPTAGQSARVEISGARRAEPGDIVATGGSFRDPADPFWQVGLNRTYIMLNGAASPLPKKLVEISDFQTASDSGVQIWRASNNNQSITIRVTPERCRRPDGFVFRNRIDVTVGSRNFRTCGNRVGEPEPVKN